MALAILKKDKPMSRECMITQKKRMVGNNRSHARNATKRTFEVNIQDTSVYSETLDRMIKIRASVHGLRTLDHKGGIDAYVTGTAKTKLHPALRPVKAQVEKVQAKSAA
jgi:large subunit ribosomal protein L28